MAEDTKTEGTAEETSSETKELNLHSAGETLRHAREQKTMSLEDVAKATRIPQRHLESIEAGDYAALPGRTYAIGFAKSYARTVGLSDATIGSQLREEMDEQGHGAYQPETSGYSPTNPSSIPPKYLAWTAGGIAALLLVGFLVWRTLFLEPTDLMAAAEETETAETASADPIGGATPDTAQPSTLSSTGTVVLTATETVWFKVYDADGKRLFENQMEAGDKFTVPADAKNPQILTGRPDALTVTIDGKVVPALGTAERTIKDVGVSAAALLARGETAGASSTVNNDQPGNSADE